MREKRVTGMRRRRVGLLLAIVGLPLLAALAGWLYLRSSLPQTRGEIRLPGLAGEVSVRRDSHGIPHIAAADAADAFFVLGFVHAQDRLWQMEMHRRIAAGRLSEFAGEATLSVDIYLRTLSLHDRARKGWAHQSPAARTALDAYARGVNAFLATRRGAWPPEFLLTGVRPEPWTPVDSLAWYKAMSLDLGGNMGRELARLDLAAVLDARRLAEFFPPYPGEPALPLPDLERLYDGLAFAAAEGPAERDPAVSGLGSNNWAVSGALTGSGAPLLANDPHLGLDTPSLWYLVHLKIDGASVVGATMPGSPFVVLGRNDRIAWGFTNTNPDVQDLYLERLTEDGERYLTPGGPEPLIAREETIAVKDGEPVTITVRETRHGPLISDARGDIRARLPEGHALALRWTALDADDTTPSVGEAILGAGSFAEFVAAVEPYVAPMQNIAYADVSGDIGLVLPGRVPLRPEADDTHGLVPKPGWKPGYDWQGYLPASELPRRHNPADGIIVTANEKVVDGLYPHHLTSEWAMPYRGDRLRALLAQRRDHDAESMARLQSDVRSTVAEDLLELILGHIDGSGDPLLGAMASWDREMRVDAPEPLVFTAWHRHLARRIYADELGDRFEAHWGPKPNFLHRVLADEEGMGRWCDDVTTAAPETCADAVAGAFDDAVDELTGRLGSDWRAWKWGEVHQIVQAHNPMSQIPLLRPVFELRAPAPGGTYTINVASPRFTGREVYTARHGPSYRAIYDLADLDRSLYIIPTGQSGNPFSRHYDDLFSLWLAGRYVMIPTGEVGGDLLRLLPERDS